MGAHNLASLFKILPLHGFLPSIVNQISPSSHTQPDAYIFRHAAQLPINPQVVLLLKASLVLPVKSTCQPDTQPQTSQPATFSDSPRVSDSLPPTDTGHSPRSWTHRRVCTVRNLFQLPLCTARSPYLAPWLFLSAGPLAALWLLRRRNNCLPPSIEAQHFPPSAHLPSATHFALTSSTTPPSHTSVLFEPAGLHPRFNSGEGFVFEVAILGPSSRFTSIRPQTYS
jgi:hypothetical protein